MSFLWVFLSAFLLQLPMGGVTVSPSGGGGPTFVQAATTNLNTNAVFSSVAANDSLLIVVHSNGTCAATTISDSAGQTWIQVGTQQQDSGSTNKCGTVYFLASANSGTHTITWTVTGSPYTNILGIETTPATLDAHAQAAPYSSAVDTGTFACTSNDLVAGLAGTSNGPLTAGVGFTMRVSEPTYGSASIETLSPSTATCDASMTNPNSNANYIFGVALK